MSEFKVGDYITPIEKHFIDVTFGKSYKILEIEKDGRLVIIDDRDDRRGKLSCYYIKDVKMSTPLWKVLNE